MALANDIRALNDRVLADLNSAHDYYRDTKIAWDIVRQVIAVGHTFSIRNMTTGTVTTQVELAGKARGYVAEQLAEATFQQFISIFEIFFLDLSRLWRTHEAWAARRWTSRKSWTRRIRTRLRY
jgi:hypothetical protein